MGNQMNVQAGANFVQDGVRVEWNGTTAKVSDDEFYIIMEMANMSHEKMLALAISVARSFAELKQLALAHNRQGETK